ncbi:MAG: TonB-dependent receptor plug domain-containing protein [Bacteroidaceae bacterium]|nr:TonB-dependent receptor plug domain-containing protein [Bacteroidaceae bacterium]
MINILLAGLFSIVSPTSTDSLRISEIDEVVVVATPKETNRLRQQPLSSTSLAQEQMRERGITGVKSLSANVPNLFIPDYGSHLTTSIYIRGIGSRTGTPAVSLYVDGVPQVSAASFDFNFSDVDRIDVLRGPQSTLYGRNSMGGVVRVFTKNPFQYQGTDLTVDGNVIPKGRFTLTHYHRVSDQFAWSINLFGLRSNGYFRNSGRDDELIDSEDDLGGRLRFIIKPTSTLSLDLTVNHEWLNQGGYPYEYQGKVGKPTTPDPMTEVGQIAYNSRSGYRRNLTNVGLTVDKEWKNATLTSVTGFQHLHDRMDLDQDFTTTDLYTLMQRQNSNTLSEEVILKGGSAAKWLNGKSSNCNYSWLLGLSALQQWNDTDGPVSFHRDGLDWLNGLINNMANSHMPTVKSSEYSMSFAFNNQILGSDLAFPGTYSTPNTNIALFHQSTFDNLLGVEGLTLAAGIRLDYEYNSLDYDARYSFNQSYGLNGILTYPDGHTRNDMVLVPVGYYSIDDAMQGSLHNDYLELMPKVSIKWKSVYATVSRGYRSGGYNIQMFSDLLQSRMQTRIMQNVTAATLPVVQAQPSMPDVAKATVETILTSMATEQPVDVQASTWYKPETSWNYELGAHLNLLNNRLQADIAAFWMDTRDQQVSQMSAGGLGRVTINSGESRSIGAEASLRAFITDDLEAQLAYGYTHAKFRNADKTFVPFIPAHTLSVGATQHWHLPSALWLDGISLHADYRAAGRIYWTEDNSAWQDFAGTVNTRLTFHRRSLDLSIYTRNLLGTRYQTFYFVTMQRGFAQYSRPATIGFELRYCF